MVQFSEMVNTGKEIAVEFSQKNVTFMAAGIAYNAFLSLAPILVILLVVVSAIGGGLEQRVIDIAQSSLPGPIADVVTEVFEGGAGDPTASFIGLIVLLWGTLKIFRGLDTAFSEIYETTTENSFVGKLQDGVVVLVALVIALVATIGVTVVFAIFSDMIPAVSILTPLVLVLGLVIAFLPMYYRFPDTDVDWRSILPGAVFAAVGWAAFQALFQVYLTFSSAGSDSLFGGVIVVITWLYFSGLVLLIGAVINAVLGGHTSGKSGGVGRGATDYETHREEEMTHDEFVAYLADIREELIDRSSRGTTGIDVDAADQYPMPDSPVTVIEQSKDEEGERALSVSFRWRTIADAGADKAQPTD